ncbi:hypothetical protein O181_085100 [Austropuccinia psidii MF-1]|uniref:Integrase catalytic domain-containing protein n=1 Tax=Austropuccinia psidii MF-1 TaxID=1389203 RepID=A0A9Q3FRI4_9BASI|nr:hypothetical protein [Austropuccinia psidii MF-1]
MFIENFSQIASPLRRLTRDDAEWEWNTKCDEAFEKLRKIVGEEIKLTNLDYEKGAGKIKFEVDSSYTAEGAILSQEDKEGKERPVLMNQSHSQDWNQNTHSQSWRDNFSGWPETIGLVKLTERSVSEWFTSEWICRYGAPKEVTVDGGPGFGKELQDVVKKAGSKIRVTTPYYPESQGMVERPHKQLKDALVKMCCENGSKLKEYLPLVTLSDRISTKRTTGYTPFELQFGQKAVLPKGIEAKTHLAIELHKVQSTKYLLEARAEQLSRKGEMRKMEKEKLKLAREDSVRYWDRKLAHPIRKPIHPGEFVLVYNKVLESQWGLLFKNRRDGPYRGVRQTNNHPYELEELDGTKLARRFAASQIKKFYPRGRRGR